MEKRGIDWTALHQRLARVEAALTEGGRERSPEETRRILEQRARVAARPAAAPDTTERFEVLVFSRSATTYGIETRYVRAAYPLAETTPVPCTPAFIFGITHLRGHVLTILDLCPVVGIPAQRPADRAQIVVLGNGETSELGLLSDAVLGVRAIDVADVDRSLPTQCGAGRQFLIGITGQSLAVLDGHRLLTDAELKVMERVIT